MARALASRRRTASLRASAARSRSIGLFVVFVLVPLYWVVITSIKPSNDYLTTPPVWFPAASDDRPLHRGAVLLSRAAGAASTA